MEDPVSISTKPPNAWVEFRRDHPIVFGFLVLGLSYGLFAVVGGVITFLTVGVTVNASTAPTIRTLQMTMQIALFLVPALLLLLPWSGDTIALLRLHRPDGRAVIWACGAVVGVQIFAQGYAAVQDSALRALLPEGGYQLYQNLEQMLQGMYEALLVSSSFSEGFFVWVVVALTPAVCEETVFRGIMQGSFVRGMAPRTALGLTALLFSLVHFNVSGFLPLLGIGVLLGVLVYKGGSLLYGVIAHLLNNTVAVVGVAVLGPPAMNDTTLMGAGLGMAVLALVGGVILTLGFVLLFLKRTAARVSPIAVNSI